MRRALLLALAACSGSPAAPLPIGQSSDGVISFYDGDGRGACGYDSTSDDFAAINAQQWNQSASCGTCIEVTGPKGVVVLRVVDLCPDCDGPGHLDLSRATYAKLAELPDGRANVKWRTVTCPVKGNLRVQVKDGSNAFWIALQPRNMRRPVASLEAKKNGAWKALVRSDYNYFLDESGLGDGPIDLRLTADDGAVVTAILPAVKAGSEIEADSQF